MTESLHVTGGETIFLLLRLTEQLYAADELAEAAASLIVLPAERDLESRTRRLRLALDRYQAAKTP